MAVRAPWLLFLALRSVAQPTAWQRDLLQRVGRSAELASSAASGALEARLDSPDVRSELEACSPGTRSLSARKLAQRLREEVAVAEVVSGFDSPGWPTDLPLKEAVAEDHLESQWEVELRDGLNFSEPVPAVPGWTIGTVFAMMDLNEVQLYGLKPFHGGRPRTRAEAAERPPYAMVNLHRLDSGSELYGDVSVVFADSLAAENSLVSSVDTGGWHFLCNVSGPLPFPTRGHKVDCAAFGGFAGLGTLRHFDHLLLANEAYWRTSLARTACRLLAPWGSYKVAGSDTYKYWEALPATQLAFPRAVKFVLASFPALFGAARGALLRRWCSERGWLLVWALGMNVQPAPDFWTAVDLPEMARDQRLADPGVMSKTTAGPPPPGAEVAFRAAWASAARLRAGNASVTNSTWASAWRSLKAVLPGSLHLEPLRAGACADPGSCVGILPGGDCLCYDSAPSQLLV